MYQTLRVNVDMLKLIQVRRGTFAKFVKGHAIGPAVDSFHISELDWVEALRLS